MTERVYTQAEMDAALQAQREEQREQAQREQALLADTIRYEVFMQQRQRLRLSSRPCRLTEFAFVPKLQ